MRRGTLLFVLCFAAGCGSGYQLAPVSGRVTVEGKPVAGLHVAFEPVGSKENPNPGPGSIALTDADGRYSLTTAIEKRRGAVVGPSRVRIRVIPAQLDETDPKVDQVKAVRAARAERHLPLRYNDKTELTFEVPPDGTDSANFDLAWK
jgi:hypothetical protein